MNVALTKGNVMICKKRTKKISIFLFMAIG
jgi:hypothetical protein